MKKFFPPPIIILSIVLSACYDTPSGYVEIGDVNVTLTMDSLCRDLTQNLIVDGKSVFWASTATTTIKMVAGHHTIASWDGHLNERWKTEVNVTSDTTITLDCRW